MDNLNESIENLIRQLNSFSDSGTDRDLANSHTAASEELKAAVDNIVNGSSLFVKGGLGGTLKALSSSQGGMTKYTSGISALGTGVAQVGAGLLGIGAPLMGLAAVITMVTGAVFKQNDAIISNYDKLSDFGAAGSFTATQLLDMAQSANVTSGKLDKYSDTIKKVGGNLLSLGSTAGDGMKQFIELSRVTSDTRSGFRHLGVSQEELTEIQASYVNETALMATRNTRDMNYARMASLRYANEIIEMTALTGMSRKEAIEIRQKQLADVSFNLSLQSKSPTVAASILKKASLFAGIIEDENLTSGLRQFMTVGRAIDENGNRFSRLLGDRADIYVQQLLNGTLSTVDLLKMLDKNLNTIQTVEKEQALFSPGFRDAFNITANSMKFHNKIVNLANDEEAERLVKTGKDTTDPLLKLRDTIVNTENALALAFDNLISLISGPVNTAFNWLLKTFNDATNAISDSVIGRVLGLSKSKPMAFSNTDDAKQLLSANTEKIAKIKNDLSSIEQDASLSTYDSGVVESRIEMNAQIQNLEEQISAARKYLSDAEKKNQSATTAAQQQSPTTASSPTPSTTSASGASSPSEPSSPPSATAAGSPTPMSPYEAADANVRAARTKSYKKEKKERDELLSLFTFGGNATIDGFKKLDIKMQESLINMATVLQRSQGNAANKEKLMLLDTYANQDARNGTALETGEDPNAALSKIQSGRAVRLNDDQLNRLNKFDSLQLNNLEIPKSDDNNKFDPGTVQLKAKKGGIFTGPMSGFGIEMHGLEAVVPLPNGQNIPVTIKTDSPLLKSLDQLNGSLINLKGLDKLTSSIENIPTKIDLVIDNFRKENSELIESFIMGSDANVSMNSEFNEKVSLSITRLDSKIDNINNNILPQSISIDKSSGFVRDINEISKILEDALDHDTDDLSTTDDLIVPVQPSPVVTKIKTPKLTTDMLKMLSDNLDTLITRMKENTGIQADMLRVARR